MTSINQERTISSQLSEHGLNVNSDKLGDFGIEIETEVKKESDYPDGFLSQRPDNMWDLPELPAFIGHHDGSLRDFGVEYVFKAPLDFDAAYEALKDFGKKTKNIPFIQNSPGTSVHVHTNLAKYSWRILGNYLTTYCLIENSLSVLAGPTRVSNLFALPMRCAGENHDQIVKIFVGVANKNIQPIRELNQQIFKYAGLNLCPLKTSGSVECRLMRGVTDVEVIKVWLTVLNELLQFSKTPGLTPPDIMTEFANRGVDVFNDVFPTTHQILPNLDTLVTDRSVFNAGWLSDCVDFNKLDMEIVKTPKRSKSLKKYFTPGELVSHGINSSKIQYLAATGQGLWFMLRDPETGLNIRQVKLRFDPERNQAGLSAFVAIEENPITLTNSTQELMPTGSQLTVDILNIDELYEED